MLLLFWKNKVFIASFIALSMFLSGCRQTPPEPTLDATGYLDDEGSVRIWRKDLVQTPLVVKTAYQPYHNGHEVITTYHYVSGSLSEISRQIHASSEIMEQLRFDDDKKLTFNQRILSDRKEMIKQIDIDNLVYQANEILQLSTVLRAGQVKLIQGYFQNDNVITCQGDNATLNLERSQQNEVEKYPSQFKPLYIAWLHAPSGDELLQLTGNDLCASEPTLGSLN